ncbi:hypothetical protein ABW19_dt0206409 [Dactylella cylindrospora]|nr:hypothetical protein ABW19_dt0206409 [Dactylella cylindrospora]
MHPAEPKAQLEHAIVVQEDKVLQEESKVLRRSTQHVRHRSQENKIKQQKARFDAERKLTQFPTAPEPNVYQNGLPALPSLPVLPTAFPVPMTPPATIIGTFAQKLAQRRVQRTDMITPTPPTSPTIPRTPSTSLTPLNLDLSSLPLPRNMPQAKTLISDIAKQIDFDYLYIIRLEPTSTKLTYNDLLSVSNFQIVMVHSYRRNPTPSGSANQALNTELHLKALRDRRGLTAINARENNRIGGTANEEFYQISVLLPVQRDYVDEKGHVIEDTNRRSASSEENGRVCRGYILGAYKRRNNGDYKAAIEKLGSVANALGILMFEVGV